MTKITKAQLTAAIAAAESDTIQRSKRKLKAEFERQNKAMPQAALKHGMDPAMIQKTMHKGTARPGVEPKLIDAERVKVLAESVRFDQMIAGHPEVAAALSSRNITIQSA